MVESIGVAANANNKDFKFVNLPQFSPSFIMNNLTTNGGDLLVYAHTGDGQPKAVIYSKDLIEKGEVFAPVIYQWKDQGDCMGIKHLSVQGKWYLVISTSKGC